MNNPITAIKQWWHNCHTYAILDTADSSVTLSRKLFQHIKSELADDAKEAKVFTFYIPESDSFGFMVNPTMDYPTQMGQIQYNQKYHCVGYETLNPTVAMILYRYGIDTLNPVKLSVSIKQSGDGKTFYQFCKPKK